MDLVINNTYYTNDILVGCDSAEWNGVMYSASGVYVDTLQSLASCDSIITMNMSMESIVNI